MFSACCDYSDKSDNTDIIHDKTEPVKERLSNSVIKIAVEVGRELSMGADTSVCPCKAK